jgi:hypothetical protein
MLVLALPSGLDESLEAVEATGRRFLYALSSTGKTGDTVFQFALYGPQNIGWRSADVVIKAQYILITIFASLNEPIERISCAKKHVNFDSIGKLPACRYRVDGLSLPKLASDLAIFETETSSSKADAERVEHCPQALNRG